MADTFIDLYLKHTSIYESPLSFWRWSAYSTISGVLKDTAYLRQGDSALFPNIYVLFLAESSGHRKGRPVELSETLVNKVNKTKIISGRSSVQAILDELARTETDEKTGKVVKSSSAIIYAPELAAGIVNDSEGLKILTDLYDYKQNPYKNRLRTGPCFNLERVVISLLSASNEDMIKDFFGVSEIKGGLLARIFLVTPNEFRPSNDLLDIDSEERKASLNCVLSKLIELSKLHGEFHFTDPAKTEYKTWYGPFRQSYEKRKEATGVVGRIHTGVIKLAMILAANDLSMEVTKEHVESSIEQCLGLIPNYSLFTMNNSKTDIGQAGGLVITDLLSAGHYMLTRKTIMRNHWQQFDADLLDKVIVTLEQAEMIRQVLNKSETYYQLTNKCLEIMGKDT